MSSADLKVVKGAAEERGSDTTKDQRPTFDQLYLAARINDLHAPSSRERRSGPRITAALLQRWVLEFGHESVSDALRLFHGFPPAKAVNNPVAYVLAILRKGRRG